MDTGVLHTGFDAGALGFWIFIAAIVVAAIWSGSRREAEKHETMRRIVEKTGVVDEGKLKELFKPASPYQGRDKPPGGGYRALRVTGTIVMFIAAGLVAYSLIRAHAGAEPPQSQVRPMINLPNGRSMPDLSWRPPDPPFNPVHGLAAAALVALFGAGLFCSSRFLPLPPPSGSRTELPAP
ncbi:MAG TPA: hypothetical protein VGV09_17965 [Steroidobacteraceae bacterium]|nr:hypothetical protein [Steroidobacteraceae bacterium]